MHKQRYDWLFIFAVVVVLGAFVATSIQDFGGDNSAILAVIAAVAGLLSNISAARFEQKDQTHESGTLNTWFVGLLTAAALYVALNAIVFVVGLVLLSEEGQFVQRHAGFVNDRGHFGEYVALSSSSVAALFMSVISVVAGSALIARSREHLRATLIASVGHIIIALIMRLAALVHGDITQFRLFEQIGWDDVIVGALMNLSVVSSMLWLGVVLARGRRS
jgi:hypothetical protein